MMALKPWKKGAFETNKYRNLFVEMGYKQADVDAKLKEVFNDVFRGPNKVYFEVGDSMGYVSDIKNHDARTEGMSYGLMIAVQFGEKDIFDRLWRWTKRYMQHQDGIRKGYFAWSCKTDGTRNSRCRQRRRALFHHFAHLCLQPLGQRHGHQLQGRGAKHTRLHTAPRVHTRAPARLWRFRLWRTAIHQHPTSNTYHPKDVSHRPRNQAHHLHPRWFRAAFHRSQLPHSCLL